MWALKHICIMLNHNKTEGLDLFCSFSLTKQNPPQWKSSRFLSDHRWYRVWFFPASSCQRCRHSPHLSRRCLFERRPAHLGPQIQIPPCPRSRIWCWREAPATQSVLFLYLISLIIKWQLIEQRNNITDTFDHLLTALKWSTVISKSALHITTQES